MAPGRRVTTHSPKFNVDNPAGADIDRRASVLKIVNAFVKTDRSIELPLQFGVRIDVVPPKRLLDHDQIKRIEFLQAAPHPSSVYARSSRPPSGECAEIARATPARRLNILPRFDFDFDPLITGSQFLLHFS